MKKQFLLIVTLIMSSCFSSTITAQAVTKKKTTPATVKKAIVGANKKKSNAATSAVKSTVPNKSKAILLDNNEFGRYKCKVAKTKEGCTITFDAMIDPNSELAKKEGYCIKKDFRVNYSDNSITDQSAGVVVEKQNKIKTETAIMNEEELAAANENQGIVQIRGLNFSFDLSKGNKDVASTNNECYLPAKLADGAYEMKVNWTWDMPSSKVNDSEFTAIFKISVKGGMIVDIKN